MIANTKDKVKNAPTGFDNENGNKRGQRYIFVN